MKPEHIVAIALRVFAIYLSVSTITGLITSGWFYIASGSNMLSSTLVLLVTVLSLATAYLLWGLRSRSLSSSSDWMVLNM